MTNRTNIARTQSPVQRFALFTGVLVLAFASQVFVVQAQQSTIDPDAIIATVGEATITESDLAFAAEDLAQELSNVPTAERRSFLTTVLIDMKVMAGAARAENLQESEIFHRRQKYLVDRSLRRAYFAEKITAAVTPEAVDAAYQELVAGFAPQEEIRARHILVTDESDAKMIKAEIDAGKPFEIAAMENSIDGSSQNGGDLGYFGRGQMVPPFEQAAFGLEVGGVSAPVQSQFGWHIIKLEDRRQSAPPPFAQVAQQLQQQVLFQIFDETVKQLKSEVVIEVTDPEIAAAIARDDAARSN